MSIITRKLINAIREKNVDKVRACIKAGADLTFRLNADPRSLFHLAASKGNKEIVQLLVESGVDIHQEDMYGNLALHHAAASGNDEVAHFLIEMGSDVNAKDSQGHTPLFDAINNGHESMVRILIEGGSSVTARDKTGNSTLHWVSRFGRESLVAKMIASGIDVNAVDKDGATALHLAIKNGHLSTAIALVGHGADVNAKDNAGESPLIFALNDYMVDENIIQLLIDSGADVNQTNNNGNSPLLYGVLSGSQSAIKKLTEARAVWSSVDREICVTLGASKENLDWVDAFVANTELEKIDSSNDGDDDGLDFHDHDERGFTHLEDSSYQKMRL